MWYAVWLTTGREIEDAEQIRLFTEGRGYDNCWIPVRMERRKIGDHVEDVEKPLFPGYIFLEARDPEDLYLALKKFPRFSLMLKTGENYTPISPEEETFIRRLTDESGKAAVSLGVIKDKKLRVIEGPLKGLEQYVVKIDRHKKKATLEMHLLGKTHVFRMGLEVVEKT